MALGGHLAKLVAFRSTHTARKTTLKFMTAALFSSQADIPFKITGSCQALVYHSHGLPHEILQMEHGHILQRPDISSQSPDSLVHLKMLAAPINPADLNQVQGNYPLQSSGPVHIGGNEGVAVVVAVGKGVKELAPGDWVIPKVGAFGTWREQVVCLDSDVQKIPSSTSLSVAATLKVNPPTAYRLLRDFHPLKRGDVIVQNGANSAVGRCVIQMAKHAGIRTINVIRDRPNYEALEKELRGLGATVVVKSDLFSTEQTQAYLCESLGLPRPILGFNCVGSTASADMARCLADGATLVTYGGMGGKNPITSAASMIFRDIKYCGFWMSRWYQMAAGCAALGRENQEMVKNILEMYRLGALVEPRTEFFEFKPHWKDAIQKYTNPPPQQASKTSDAKPLLKFN